MDHPVTPHLARTPAKAPAAPARKGRHRALKRAAWAFAGLLVILLIIFIMLPVWISNEQGRTYVLSHISKRINGTLAIRNWQLGWFRGTTIDDLTITGPDGKQLLHCPRIETDLTLWSLLWGNYDLGNTRIEAPRLTATLYRDGSNDFTRLIKPNTTGPNPLGTIRGNIVCVNASGQLAAEDAAMPLTFNEGVIEIPIASHTAPIHLKISGVSHAVDASKKFDIVADLPPPSTWADNPTGLLSSVNVSAGAIPTATLARWMGLDPRWQGSFGPALTSFEFDAKPQAGHGSLATLSAAGPLGIVRMKMTMLTEAGNIKLSPVERRSAPLAASLTLSPPLITLLTRVNPVFASLERTGGPIEFEAQNLALDVDHPAATTGTVLVLIPAMSFRQEGFFRDALRDPDAPDPAATQPGPSLVANSVMLKLTLADGRISYNDLGLSLSNRQRLVFTGSTGVDGTLDLVFTLSSPRPSGGMILQVPVKGTIDKPRLEYPRIAGPS